MEQGYRVKEEVKRSCRKNSGRGCRVKNLKVVFEERVFLDFSVVKECVLLWGRRGGLERKRVTGSF